MFRVSSGDCNNEPNASVINFTTHHTRCQRLRSISICKPNLFLIIAYYSLSLLGLWDGVCQESQKQEFQPRLERKHTTVSYDYMSEPSDKPKSKMIKTLGDQGHLNEIIGFYIGFKEFKDYISVYKYEIMKLNYCVKFHHVSSCHVLFQML